MSKQLTFPDWTDSPTLLVVSNSYVGPTTIAELDSTVDVHLATGDSDLAGKVPDTTPVTVGDVTTSCRSELLASELHGALETTLSSGPA